MAKGTKLKVYGAVTGEGIVYETTDKNRFVVTTPVSNPTKEKDWCEALTNNPETVTEIIQVFPASEITYEPVDYYSAETPKPGHIFVISGSNDAIQFKGQVRYNDSIGFATNKVVAIRFEVINLKAHKEKAQEFASQRANIVSKRMDMVSAIEYFGTYGNGRDKYSSSRYLVFDKTAENVAKIMLGTFTYDNSIANAVLAAQGKWSTNDRNKFKNGKLSGYDSTLANDVEREAQFLADLQKLSKGMFEATGGKLLELAKFYYVQTSKGRNIDLVRVLAYLKKNPTKAFGQPCTCGCGLTTEGYIDRINRIGAKSGPKETWENVYLAISLEPGF